jgi:hypothetical protein
MGDLIQAIINFFKSLFGGGDDKPALPAGGSTAAPAGGGYAKPPSGDDDYEDSDTGNNTSYAQENWKELQQLIARVESGMVQLNGVDWQDPAAIWKHQFAIEEKQGQGMEFHQAAQGIGYTDGEHFRTVMAYCQAKWSYMGRNDDGEEEVLTKDEFTNGAINARMGQMQGMQAAAIAADPNLLAPVDGVTVEQWAAASAQLAGLGNNATPQQVAAVFAKNGLDQQKYNAANEGWQAKMQGDTTGAIATKFGEAFAAAQGQAGGYSMDQRGGSGPEPVSFERFVEIMAAQSAWAEQGMDVNAQLQAVFGINAAEYSRYSSYWSPKMATDVAMIRKYTELEAKYKAKYAGAAMDDDLSL